MTGNVLITIRYNRLWNDASTSIRDIESSRGFEVGDLARASIIHEFLQLWILPPRFPFLQSRHESIQFNSYTESTDLLE